MSLYNTTSEGLKHFYFSFNENVNDIILEENFHPGLIITKKLSYSFDNITWTGSLEYEYFNFDIPLPIGIEKIFFRLDINIDKIERGIYGSYSLESIKINESYVTIDSVEIGKRIENILNLSERTNNFNPYRFSDFQKDLYDKLSVGVKDIFGMPILYFRTESDHETESITFKTYKLNNVVEVKQIKVNVQGNEIPDNLERFDEYGFDFQEELVIHIVKQEFWEKFGTDKIPNSNDYFYWPFTDKMYQVNSPYEKKTFMQYATYWAVITTKFENRANVIEIDDDDEFHKIENIIEYTHNYKSDNETIEQTNAAKDFDNPEKLFSDNNKQISEHEIIDQNIYSFKYTFNYFDKKINEVHKTSNFYQQFKENDNVIFCTWFRTSNENQKLFELINESEDFIISVKDSNINITQNISIMSNLPNIIVDSLLEYEIKIKEWYGLITKLINNTLIIELWSMSGIGDLEKLSEKIISITKQNSYPTNLNIFGALEFSQIRISRKDIDSENLLVNKLPNKKDFVLIMNATPEISLNPKA